MNKYILIPLLLILLQQTALAVDAKELGKELSKNSTASVEKVVKK